MRASPDRLGPGPAPAVMDSPGRYAAKVFRWMALGMSITAAVAIPFALRPQLLQDFMDTIGFLPFLAVLLAPLILSITMAGGIRQMKVRTAEVLFILYSACMGVTASMLLLSFGLLGGAFAFAAAALCFGALALWGWYTGRDLSGIRPILFAGFAFAIILGLLILIFPSRAAGLLHCLLVFALFLALTAFDVQQIRTYYARFADSPEIQEKASVYAALQLYLDFFGLWIRALILSNRMRRTQ